MQIRNSSITVVMRCSVPLLLFLGFICSCSSSEESPLTQDKVQHLLIDGFSIPKMNSATEQLSLALVSDDEQAHRIALFKAVPLFFPEKREQIGLADLERTYLGLGADYRSRPPALLQKTADIYQQLSTTYRDVPPVAAKALWYHAWLKADLLEEKDAGSRSYKILLEAYPKQRISQEPSIPWISTQLSDNRQNLKANAEMHQLTWAELAYLELIRNAQSATQGVTLFISLIENYPNSSLKVAARTLLAEKTDIDYTTIQTRLQESKPDLPAYNQEQNFTEQHHIPEERGSHK